MIDHDSPAPLREVTAAAPIRICDIGGWTDTWFARHGHVCNMAVSPLVEVRVEVFATDRSLPRVTIRAANPGDGGPGTARPAVPGEHPLIEAAIDAMPLPGDVRLVVHVQSVVPPAAGTGTSAAVSVAVIGALDLLTPGHMTAEEIARAAHDVEVRRLGQECGVQDQLASALGGISFIDITDYPRSVVTRLDVPEGCRSELERRLVLVFLGRAHDSSSLHRRVIERLQGAGPDCAELDALRQCAVDAKRALLAGDVAALGHSMIDNTEAQASLHPDLVSPDAREVMAIARAHGALGWKVNGAGGNGGSVTLLAGAVPDDRRAMLAAITDASPLFREIPLALRATGVERWSHAPSQA